jgi:hypothetical protein
MTSHTTQGITRYGSGLLLFPEFRPNLKSISVREPTPSKRVLPSWIDTALERITAICALGGPKTQSPTPLNKSQNFSLAHQQPSHVLEQTEIRTQQLAEAMEEHHTIISDMSHVPEPAVKSKSAHVLASGSETENDHPDILSEATATRASRGWAKATSPGVAVLKLRAAKSGCLKPMTRKEMVRFTAQAAVEYQLKYGDDEEDEDYVDSSDDENDNKEMEKNRERGRGEEVE